MNNEYIKLFDDVSHFF